MYLQKINNIHVELLHAFLFSEKGECTPAITIFRKEGSQATEADGSAPRILTHHTCHVV